MKDGAISGVEGSWEIKLPLRGILVKVLELIKESDQFTFLRTINWIFLILSNEKIRFKFKR